MNRIVACLLGAALLIWSLALLRELWAALDPRECDRRLRRAGLPSWFGARQWWLTHGCVLALLALLLPWSAARHSWAAALISVLLLGIAWRVPHLWLRWRIRQRRAALRRALPGVLARLCWATHCLAPFEEALQLTLRWGCNGPLDQILQQQLLRTASARAPHWPRPRVDHPLTPLVAELLDAARAAQAGRIDLQEQLRQWQWLLVRSHPAARPAYDPRRRHAGVPAPDAARDVEVTL